FNRLWIYGGDRNLPQTYRNGSKRLKISDASSYVQRPLASGEQRREATMIFDDIYPTFTGTVTGVTGDILVFSSTSIDFDLNGQFLTGEVAKLVFKSGPLTGYEFDIASYNHETQEIKINTFTTSDGRVLPNNSNSSNRYYVGNTFTFVNISMPNSYISNAENRLLTDGQKELNKQYVLPYT